MGYIRARMRSRPTMAALAAAVLLAGCGGAPRQDENEPEGSYRLEVADATLPGLAVDRRELDDAGPRPQRRLEGRAQRRGDGRDRSGKPGEGTVAFGQRVDDARLSDPERPVWVVDEGPEGGDSAATNTWALGRARRPARPRRSAGRSPPSSPAPTRSSTASPPASTARRTLAGGGRTDGSFKVAHRRQAGPRARGRRRQRRPRRGARRLEVASGGAAAPCRPGRSARSRATTASRPCA